MSDNDVSIPPLRTGVVFAEWAPVVRDKLKAAVGVAQGRG